MSETYLEIQKLVEECCKHKCGKTPEIESDCKGVNAYVECPVCHGDKVVGYYGRWQGNRSRECSMCGGTGQVFKKYTCVVRLISDNADYHNEMNNVKHYSSWRTVLENDLEKLSKMRVKLLEESEHGEQTV